MLLRVFLGGYFIYAGTVKALDPVVFLKGVNLYKMLPLDPPVFLNGTAIILPWLEIVCGIALVLGLMQRGAAALIALMLCVFTPAIFLRSLAVMGEQGISFFEVEFDCGCGTGNEIIWIKLAKNTGLFLLAVFAVFSRSRRFSLAALFERLRRSACKCPRCGAALPAGTDGPCDRCREPSLAPAGPSPDAAT